MKTFLAIVFLMLTQVLPAQPTFMKTYSSLADTIGYVPLDISLHHHTIFVLSSKPIYELLGDEIIVYNQAASMETFSLEGHRQWSTSLSLEGKYFPQGNQRSVLVSDSTVWVSIDYVDTSTGAQTAALFTFGLDGGSRCKVEMPTGLGSTNGPLFDVGAGAVRLVFPFKPSEGLEVLQSRIYDAECNVLGVADIPRGDVATLNLQAWPMNDGKIILKTYYYDLGTGELLYKHDIFSVDEANEVLWRYDSTVNFGTFLYQNAASCALPNGQGLFTLKNTATQNLLEFERCAERIDLLGASSELPCAQESDGLPIMGQMVAGLQQEFYAVGAVILDPNPTPNSLRLGYIVKYDSLGAKIWSKVLIDSTHANVNVGLSGCELGDSGHLFFSGSLSWFDGPDDFGSALILGCISPDGCINGECSDTIYISQATSALPEPTAQSIKISPNPAADRILLDWPADSDLNVQIFDNQGLLVQQGRAAPNGEVPVAGLAPGFYFLKIMSEKGVLGVGRFVKSP
jgi:hypothetical protein